MPGAGHHTAKFDRCVEQVTAKGNDKSSAYEICTAQFQKSGEDILNAEQSRGLHLVGATSKARHDTWNGKPYLVVPTVMLMEGVIHAVNAEAPEFVPKSLIETDPSQWDGHPILLGHAVRGGKQCSAHDDAIQAAQRFGTIRNTYAKDGKLGSESWCDVARLKELGREDVVRRLEEGDPIQVSVGAFVSSDGTKVGDHHGKKYKGQWLAYRSDHLAFLPDGRGACSLEMGCGTHRAATMRVLADRFEVETPALRAAAGARHSASDMKVIQQVHDHATTLGAKCAASNTKFMSYSSKSRPERTAALLKAFRAGQPYEVPDTPAQAASEEAAELIGYKTIRMLFDQVNQSYDEASALIDDLIADEEENPTETAADEEAEEEIEDARLQAINALCTAMWSALGSVQSVTNRLMMPDPGDVSSTRYMAAGKDCPTCDGTGQVASGKKQVDCPTCDGSGKIRAAEKMRHACGCNGTCGCGFRSAIKHEGGKWILYSKDGTRRLGMHNTEADAIAHGSAVEAAKKRRALELKGA